MFEYLPYNVAPWGWELAVYFFLIGMASMAFVIAAAPNVFGGSASALTSVQRPTILVVLALIAVCGVLLIMDLGQPSRFLYPIIYFHASSPLSWGSVLLVLFVASIVLFGWALMQGNARLAKTMGVIGSLLALTMPLYTGVDLMANQAREVWASPLVPMLFVSLSVTTGCALVSVLAIVFKSEDDNGSDFLRKVTFWSVFATLVLFVMFLINLSYGSEEQQQALAAIGEMYSMRLWLITFLIGIVVPLLILVLPQFAGNVNFVAVAAILGAVGAYAFREVILYAGQLPQLYY